MNEAEHLERERGDAVDRVAHALADGTRRSLLRLVRDDEVAAGDLAAAFPTISRPAVSQHLRVLRDAGLVDVRTAGKHRLYRANASGLVEMWRYLDEMWVGNLQRLKLAAERAEWSDRMRQRPGTSTSQNPDPADETSNS